MEVNKIYNIDCIDGLNEINDDFINLIVTSPPYNVNIQYDTYRDDEDYIKYLDFLNIACSLMFKKLKEDGRLVINVGDKQNGKIALHNDVINICKNIGFTHMTTIIWNKNQVSSRTAWGSFMSPSCPSFPSPFEYILIFSKNATIKLKHTGNADLTKEEFIKFSLGMWSFAPETKQKKIGHPAMFPEELPYRCIKMLSYVNDIVCDPFNGAGTTTLVAKKLNRNYIGFDISEQYCNIAKKRLEDLNDK